REMQTDRLADARQPARIAGRVIGAVGQARQLLELVTVERGRNREALVLERRARLGADADGVNAHAGGRRHVGDVQGVYAARVLAVGESDDDGAAVVADVDLALVVVQRRGVDVDGLASDRVERREQALADRRAAADRRVVDGGVDVGVARRWVLYDHRAVAEGHHADAHRRRLLVHERTGRGLGRLDPAGLDVGGPH